jgi:hypothetical protein
VGFLPPKWLRPTCVLPPRLIAARRFEAESFQQIRLARILHPHLCPMPARFLILCGCLVPTMSAQTLWSLQSLTPVVQSSGALSSALSASGDVYIAGPPGAFTWPQPTNSIGSTNSEEFLVSRLDASGKPLYATAIGGAFGGSLTLDAAGNLYFYGSADAKAFATTPGAANASAYVSSGDFVCKLSPTDGSIIFCSFPGMGVFVGLLTADSNGNVYFTESPLEVIKLTSVIPCPHLAIRRYPPVTRWRLA